MRPGHATDRVLVKLREGIGAARLVNGRLVARGGDLGSLETELRAAGVDLRSMRRSFTRPAAALEAERLEGERRSGRQLADLTLYFTVAAPGRKRRGAVRPAESPAPGRARRPVAPPVDIPPPTPRKGPGLPAMDLTTLAAGTTVQLTTTTGSECWSSAFEAGDLDLAGTKLRGTSTAP